MADMSPEDKKMSDAISEAIIAFNCTAIHGHPAQGGEQTGNWDHVDQAYHNLKKVWTDWTYNKFFPE